MSRFRPKAPGVQSGLSCAGGDIRQLQSDVPSVISRWKRRKPQPVQPLRLQGRVPTGRYAPRLWSVWLVAPIWVGAAIVVACGIYLILHAAAVPRHGPDGGPVLVDPLDVIKTTITVAGFIGAILVGVYGYRKQRLVEGDAHRADAEQFSQRYTTAAEQLGHEKAAVRLAGVYAMARLADDWSEQRQVCINVLCAYLRMPYEPDSTREKYREGEREVRLTIIRIIRDHLLDPSGPDTWRGLDLDFTNATFDGGNFSGARFTGGRVSFANARFSSGTVYFSEVEFSGSTVFFDDAEFSGGKIYFNYTKFDGGRVSFGGAKFSGSTFLCIGAKFSGSDVFFNDAELRGDEVFFIGADFSGGKVFFITTKFSGSNVSFDGAKFSGSKIIFEGAEFSGGNISFGEAEFSNSEVSFVVADFVGSEVFFDQAEFSGGKVSFDQAEFSGGEVSFDGVEITGSDITWGPFEPSEPTALS